MKPSGRLFMAATVIHSKKEKKGKKEKGKRRIKKEKILFASIRIPFFGAIFEYNS